MYAKIKIFTSSGGCSKKREKKKKTTKKKIYLFRIYKKIRRKDMCCIYWCIWGNLQHMSTVIVKSLTTITRRKKKTILKKFKNIFQKFSCRFISWHLMLCCWGEEQLVISLWRFLFRRIYMRLFYYCTTCFVL